MTKEKVWSFCSTQTRVETRVENDDATQNKTPDIGFYSGYTDLASDRYKQNRHKLVSCLSLY